jgi:electron transfer flavoprotein alpha subunit
MAEIWAVLEHHDGTLHEQSGELLSETVEVAKRLPVTTVCAVLLVSQQAELPDVTLLSRLGIEQLYLLEHPQFTHYTTQGYVSALAWLIPQHGPMLVMTSATPNERDCVPRLAASLHLPFVPNCLSIDLHNDELLTLRSIYEGRAYVLTRTALHGRTALVTLIPGVRGMPIQTQASSSFISSPNIIRLTPELQAQHGDERIRRVALQAPSPEEIELEAADRIVAGGRGVGQSGFTTIASFAHLLGAAVGATRVATDQGWVEHARQIGATGKIVRPKLYMACGISGAAQHTSGMSEAQTIVAINPDRSAPIFALADLGLLGDANQILPLAAKILAKM